MAHPAPISLELHLSGRRFGRSELEDRPGALELALPVLREAADGLLAEGARRAGLAAACRPGCAACCRQLVPLAAAEARDLRRRVAEMPEPVRARVLDRFERAHRELEQTGLADLLEDTSAIPPDGLEELGLQYASAGIDCPLLEGEHCLIYQDRPMACRQHAVSSSPDACRRPGGVVRRIAPFGRSMNSALDAVEGAAWVPLPLAMRPARQEPAERGPAEWISRAWTAATRGEGTLATS